MPEIKHTFQGGKMNKDLDERLVPNGQYRDAMNIQIRTTDGDSAGTVQNLQGNTIVDSNIYDSSFSHNYASDDSKIIASIADEKNDKAYFFIAAPDWESYITPTGGGTMADLIEDIIGENGDEGKKIFIDSIVEVYSGGFSEPPTTVPVVVDKYAIVSPKPSVIGNEDLPSTPFVTFNVSDASEYRVGMDVQALNSNGDDLFENAQIRSIDTTNNTITLTNQQEVDAASSVALFIFSHKDRPLNFDNSTKITGINIIDDLLFWTDNKSEPKKINITRCKSGSMAGSSIVNSDWSTHTKLKLHDHQTGGLQLMSELGEDLTEINSDAPAINDDLKEEHITVIRRAPTTAPTLIMKKTSREGNTSAYVDSFAFNVPQDDGTADITAQLGDYFTIVSDNFIDTNWIADDILTFTDAEGDEDSYVSWIAVKVTFLEYLDVNGDTSDSSTDTIRVRVLSVHDSLLVTPYSWDVELELKKPLFEKTFGRFGYRYKYEDGEYSSFSPWSELAFLPGVFDYSVKKGYNLGMLNGVRELIVKDFIPIHTDRQYDVKSIDLLFKSTDSPNVQIVKTINRRVDSQWEYFTPGIGNSNLVTGELHITSDMIHRTVPANQTLRSWDNVPRFSLAQEITANRLIYGNYTQGYNMDFEVDLKPTLISTSHNFVNVELDTLNNAVKSIKGNRKYKIGLVFGDKYGRETPVIESGSKSGSDDTNYFNSTGDIDVPKKYSWKKNSFEIKNNWSEDPPEYFDYVKYYIKETTNEYYNLIMDRWYYARDGNLWLSFPSADRNKVDLETYLILKNANGSQDAVEEKARYKIIDIQNEAPEFIRIDTRYFKPVLLDPSEAAIGSQLFDGAGSVEGTDPNALMRATEFRVPHSVWEDLIHQQDMRSGNLRMRFVGRTTTSLGVTIQEVATNWVSLSHVHSSPWNQATTVHWNEPFGDDVNFRALFNSLTGYNISGMNYYLEIKEEVPENKPEFDGRFFVLVEKDITLEYQIIKTLPIEMRWNIAGTHHISYIDSRRFNPAHSGPYSKYHVDATDYSPNLVAGSATLAEGIAKRRIYEWGGGRDSTGEWDAELKWPGNKFHPVCGFNGGLVDGWNCDEGGGENNNWNTGRPRISDFALGHNTCDSQQIGYGVACNGHHTRDFWQDWIDFYKDSPDERGGGTKWDRIFLDAARAAQWYWNVSEEAENDLGISSMNNQNLTGWYFGDTDGVSGSTTGSSGGDLPPNYPITWAWYEIEDSNEWDSDQASDNGTEIDSPMWSAGRYYKPWGLDRNPHDPDGPGLNRMLFSMLALNDNWTWEGDVYSQHKHERFKGSCAVGSYFTFPDDPTVSAIDGVPANIYRIRMVETTGNDTEGNEWINCTINYMGGKNMEYAMTSNAAAWEILIGPGTSNNIGFNNPVNENGIPNQPVSDDSYFGDNDTEGWFWGHEFSDEDNSYPTYDASNPEVGQEFLGLDYDKAATVPNLTPTWGTGSHRYFSTWNAGLGDSDETAASQNSGSGLFPDGPGGGTDYTTGPKLVSSGTKIAYHDDEAETARRHSVRITFDLCDPETGLPYPSGHENFLKGIDTSIFDPRGYMRHDGATTMKIQFLNPTTVGGQSETNDLAACWETEPKENVDLDLYYEASDAIPLRLKKGNTLAFAPINSKVAVYHDRDGTIVDANLNAYLNGGYWSSNTYNHYVKNVLYTSNTSLIEIYGNTQADNNGDDVAQERNIGIGSNLTFTRSDGTRTTSRVTDFYEYGDNQEVVPAERRAGSFTYSATQDEDEDVINIEMDAGVDEPNHAAIIVGDNVPPGIFVRKYYDQTWSNGTVVSGWTYRLSSIDWLVTYDSSGNNTTPTNVTYEVEFIRGTGLYEIDSDVYKYDVKLGWFNCYSFGNGVESDRIGDDYNAPQIDNGVKVSSTFTGYREEYKTSGLIHSGLYNSTSEVNDLNEFNMSDKITKDLNPSYGSIQALKTRDTDVVVFTEDKVLKVLASKDAVYNADGNPQLVATNRTLGQVIPFVGDYGISKNPESLAWDQFRLYFTDKQRGAVLRLSRDGLTPISSIGMKTWFRDNLKKTDTLLGTFDTINGEYNLTLDYNSEVEDEDVTISFNEASKGWVSFKSFVPEAGLSVSDKYLTAKYQNIWQHYIPEFNSIGGCDFDNCIQRNTFYNDNTESSITVLFNDVPGSVKSFKTMNYEGSQARIIPHVGSTESESDGEYYNLITSEIEGWYVNSFKTDLQEGEVIDFKNKENKWFNKITGLETTLTNLETGDFSVQGLGKPISVILEDGENQVSTGSSGPPSYDSLYPAGANDNNIGFMQEGETIDITVSTSNVPPGTTFEWTTSYTPMLSTATPQLTEIDFQDPGDPNSCGDTWAYGVGVIGYDGTATFSVGVCDDNIADGNQTFLVSIISSSDNTNTFISANGTLPLSCQIVVTDTGFSIDDMAEGPW